MRFVLLGPVGWGREPGWCEGQEGGRGGPWEPSLPTLPRPAPPVGRQESRHLLRKLSDDDHHLVAPERQRGPRVQRLRPLLQAAQCERPRPSLGTRALCCGERPGPPSPAWLGLGSERQKGFPRGGQLAGGRPPGRASLLRSKACSGWASAGWWGWGGSALQAPFLAGRAGRPWRPMGLREGPPWPGWGRGLAGRGAPASESSAWPPR